MTLYRIDKNMIDKNFVDNLESKTTTLSSIAVTPLFVGQIAVVSGVAYIGTGISSIADWKQITN